MEGNSKQPTPENQVGSVADRDYQLHSALNLLKGLHILNRKGADTAQ